jgi:hypothetical protein
LGRSETLLRGALEASDPVVDRTGTATIHVLVEDAA